MEQLQSWMRTLGEPGAGVPDYSVQAMALSLLLAFVLGQLIAWVYQWTHSGLSYSRSFTQSLVLLTMVVSLVMYVIGDSVITAFGLIGALAIIRFRNVLKDTRDTVFVFFALVLGMALGSQRHLAALFGALLLLSVTVYLHVTAFGSRGIFDGHLSIRLGGEDRSGVRSEFGEIVRLFCRKIKEISVRETVDGSEHVYQVRLRDSSRTEELVAALREVNGVADVALVIRDELGEV